MPPYRIFTHLNIQSFTTLWDLPESFRDSFPIATMTSADFSICNSYSPRSPQVKHLSFIRSLRHLPIRDCWLRASQRCACLPSRTSLCMPFLFSLPRTWCGVSTGICAKGPTGMALPHAFGIVSLPSDVQSLVPPLRLTNRLHQLACKGLAPFG